MEMEKARITISVADATRDSLFDFLAELRRCRIELYSGTQLIQTEEEMKNLLEKNEGALLIFQWKESTKLVFLEGESVDGEVLTLSQFTEAICFIEAGVYRC